MIENYDPNSIGLSGNNIFSLPSTEENSKLIIIPVPWEVTVSYRNGTAKGPEKILEASKQVDLYDSFGKNLWQQGIFMPEISLDILQQNDYLRHCAELIISNLEEGGETKDIDQLQKKLAQVNEGGATLEDYVYNQTNQYLEKNKLVALLGGDHSTPLGFIKAIAEKYEDIGIIQFDAHADLRNAYEGFTYSHASIMYNVITRIPQVSKLVQVGIRDYCDEEVNFIENSNGKIKTFFDEDLKHRMYDGETWKSICDSIINELPQLVYISFDIDGLDPKLCGNTGTPVPGGFDVEEIMYLFQKIVSSGRKVIAFDLNEVSAGEGTQDSVDATVGARVLYKLCNILLKSNVE